MTFRKGLQPLSEHASEGCQLVVVVVVLESRVSPDEVSRALTPSYSLSVCEGIQLTSRQQELTTCCSGSLATKQTHYLARAQTESTTITVCICRLEC